MNSTGAPRAGPVQLLVCHCSAQIVPFWALQCADQQPTPAEFARRAYKNAILSIYETHSSANGVTPSESSKTKFFSGNDENELEVHGEVLDAMTERVGDGAKAGGSDTRPILTTLNQRPRPSVQALLADPNQYLRDGTQSQKATAREIIDAIKLNAIHTGITLQQFANSVNRDLA